MYLMQLLTNIFLHFYIKRHYKQVKNKGQTGRYLQHIQQIISIQITEGNDKLTNRKMGNLFI